MKFPHVEIVEKAHVEATHADPYLVSIGFSMMGKSSPPAIKRTSSKKFIALQKQGLGASGIAHRLKDSRSLGQAKKKVNPQTCNRVREVSAENNSTSQVRNRLLADKLGFVRESARRVLKAFGMRPLKHAKQVRNSATKMVHRQRMGGELVAVYEGGMRAKIIFRSGENWVDENTCEP